MKNFELTLDKIHKNNPFMIIVLGNFNAKSNWWKADITSSNWWKADITSLEGSMIDTIASSYGLNQLTSQMH